MAMTNESDVRSDAVVFANDVLNVDVWDHQAGPLRSTARNVNIAGGRRSGKSATAQVKAVHVASTRRNAEVVCVLPNIDSGKDWLREASDILYTSKLKDSVTDEQTQSIEFSQGGVIRVLPATAGQLRGHGRNLLLVILEEAGFQDPEVVRHVSYALLDNYDEGAQLWQVGSPWGGTQHPFRVYFQRGVEGDQDYESFEVRTQDNPLLPKDFIERERARLSPSEAAAELDGQWSEAIGSLFPRALLEAHTAPYAIPSMEALCPPAQPIVGLDWGVSFDKTSAVYMYRLPLAELNPDREPVPTFGVFPYTWPSGTANNTIVDLIVKNPAHPRYVASETNGVGSFCSEELFRRIQELPYKWERNWHWINTTAATKTAAYSCLLSLLERGQIVLPNDPDLLRQLAGLRFEQGTRGFLKIEAEVAAVHDDLCDGLALCSLPYTANKKTACGLLQLAGPKAYRDELLPALDCETVKTGAGFTLYQRPTLQGVRGQGLTEYAEQLPARPDNERRIGDWVITTD
jgi:hypothetical protein